jgi:alcohol dehydrogenase, propanol-preferring
MRAMVLDGPSRALTLRDVPVPQPSAGQVRLRVHACGICRTDLHILDGELAEAKWPIVLGHQIVGTVEALGPGVDDLAVGDRAGVPWLGWTCGDCDFCRAGQENLCERARFTGYHTDGGYAEYAVADHRFCFRIPAGYPDLQAAPLLCAGLIGFRAFRMIGGSRRVGFYGFGSAAHILTQVARAEGREVFAFTRPDDVDSQKFARELGATWAGSTADPAPGPLDAAIIFAPAGDLVPLALQTVRKGGAVICAGIHMSDIPSFPYRILWEERVLRSVANLTRRDGQEFLELAPRVPVHTEVQVHRLEEANEALAALRDGRVRGSIVLSVQARLG